MMITLPILIPVLSIILLLFTGKYVLIKKIIGIAGASLLLVNSIFLFHDVFTNGIQVMQAGGWEAPYAIPLVVDLFSVIMLVISGLIGFSVSIYAWEGIDKKKHSNHFFTLFHAVLLGTNGIFLTGDLFNMFVWLEVMLMASFGLMVLGASKNQLEGGIKYLTLNLISSLFYLGGVAVVYSITGTLNLAELSLKLGSHENTFLVNSSAMLFFIALGIKSAIFPFFYWLPASYHTPPVAVTALFTGLLTKTGVYVLIRFFTLLFVQEPGFWHLLLIIISGFTMFIGVLTAASQMEVRRILSFHIISQIGYMIMGLGIFTTLSIAGSIYFMVHNIFAKTNGFLVSGIINKSENSFFLKDLGNLYKKKPFVAVLFFIPAMALAGVPPLSGFVGKFVLIKAGIDSKNYIIAAVSLIVSLLTLFSMIKIWNEAFWKKEPAEKPSKSLNTRTGFSLIFPSVFLGTLSIILGIGANFFFHVCLQAANQLLDPSEYLMKMLNY